MYLLLPFLFWLAGQRLPEPRYIATVCPATKPRYELQQELSNLGCIKVKKSGQGKVKTLYVIQNKWFNAELLALRAAPGTKNEPNFKSLGLSFAIDNLNKRISN
ncbi:hypothetical protein HDF15_004317 [Granulicella mallensis]|uniref:Uncharacterized protein n=1 Tax=Granulicella mallensis TaxID=940614 RepID=A0A7W7ZTN8_9BACT|nr:hypothetical protein [Granulicella mallensis]